MWHAGVLVISPPVHPHRRAVDTSHDTCMRLRTYTAMHPAMLRSMEMTILIKKIAKLQPWPQDWWHSRQTLPTCRTVETKPASTGPAQERRRFNESCAGVACSHAFTCRPVWSKPSTTLTKIQWMRFTEAALSRALCVPVCRPNPGHGPPNPDLPMPGIQASFAWACRLKRKPSLGSADSLLHSYVSVP